MKKIAPVLLLSCLSFGGFAAYHYNKTKDTKETCVGDKLALASVVSTVRRMAEPSGFVKTEHNIS